ncbi:hypothetical protein LCGC14_0540060 [marine sediment metagenome]|uniref:Uncharacterized protein n=1 Tax=marine sediment metagenome TaxID=412755 RepID=A0A0F9RXP2_9ZZZZ
MITKKEQINTLLNKIHDFLSKNYEIIKKLNNPNIILSKTTTDINRLINTIDRTKEKLYRQELVEKRKIEIEKRKAERILKRKKCEFCNKISITYITHVNITQGIPEHYFCNNSCKIDWILKIKK